MLCSPIRLFMDVTFWLARIGLGFYVENVLNITTVGGTPDCALLSAPCDSVITQVVYSFDENLVYWFDLFVVYILSTTVILTGVITNIINVIIFSRNKIATDSTNSLFLCLAVSDCLGLVLNGTINLCTFLCFTDVAMALTVFNIAMIGFYGISRYLNLLSLDIVTTISIQRAAAVTLPFKVNALFSKKNTKIIIVLLSVLCLIEIVPDVAFTIPHWHFHPFFNKTISLGYDFTWDYKSYVDISLYYMNVRGICSLALLFLSGSLTIFKLYYQSRTRATLKADPTKDAGNNSSTTREVRVVKMSLAVCAITFLTYTMAFVANQILVYYSKFLFHLVPGIVTYAQLLILSANSSYNFFLYMLMSSKFRECCKNLFSLKATETT